MIKPMPGRILVEMVPIDHTEHMGPTLRSMNLQTVDNKRHFDHIALQGRVVAVGDGVYQVRPGEVVLFKGSAGRTTDFDAADSGNDLLGERFRWLQQHECLAVIEEMQHQEVA